MRPACAMILLASLAPLPPVAGAAPALFTECWHTFGLPTITGTSSAIRDDHNYAVITPTTLRVEADAGSYYPNPPGTFQNKARLTDVYTLLGPAGTTVPVTVLFNVSYTFNRGSLYVASIYTSLSYPEIGPFGLEAQYQELLPCCSPLQISGTPNVSLSDTRDWTVGQPRHVVFQLVALSNARCSVDAGHTAVIDFIVPAGYAMTSELGWSGDPTPVEPATWSRIKATLR